MMAWVSLGGWRGWQRPMPLACLAPELANTATIAIPHASYENAPDAPPG